MNHTIRTIMELSDLFGPSGFEDDVAEYVKTRLSMENPVTDHMRNVRIERETGCDKPRVMLDAHMDEVGAIVQAIKPNGTMRFLPIGGWSLSSFPSSSFLIKAENGEKIPAVVAQKPPHFTPASERNNVLEIQNMILDCGTTSKAETEALGIHIGSAAVPDIHCRYDENRKLFYGKAFDDRIGAAAMIDIFEQLRKEELPCNLLGSFSVQEEVGERGVGINARKLRPDLLICFEGCPADDTFNEEYMIQAGLGKGPMLRHMDVSMITNWRFQKYALDTARAENIPVQESVRSGGGTNGAMVNILEGIPAIVIGIPVRYIHSSNCWCTLEDYENAVRLAIALIRRIDKDVIETF